MSLKDHPEPRLPIKPFQDWIERRITAYESDGGTKAFQSVMKDLGWSDRKLRRYRNGQMETRRIVNGRPVRLVVPAETFPLASIQDALSKIGLSLWDVYDEKDLPEEKFNGTGWCPKCDTSVVRSDHGYCLWCGAKTEEREAA